MKLLKVTCAFYKACINFEAVRNMTNRTDRTDRTVSAQLGCICLLLKR